MWIKLIQDIKFTFTYRCKEQQRWNCSLWIVLFAPGPSKPAPATVYKHVQVTLTQQTINSYRERSVIKLKKYVDGLIMCTDTKMQK